MKLLMEELYLLLSLYTTSRHPIKPQVKLNELSTCPLNSTSVDNLSVEQLSVVHSILDSWSVELLSVNHLSVEFVVSYSIVWMDNSGHQRNVSMCLSPP